MSTSTPDVADELDGVLLDSQPAAPKVPIGAGTIIATALSIAAAVHGYTAGEETAVVGSIAGGVLILGARAAQAIAIARHVARTALPWVEAIADDPDRP
jgi:hypothetical protein